jgi:hypothetical protein
LVEICSRYTVHTTKARQRRTRAIGAGGQGGLPAKRTLRSLPSVATSSDIHDPQLAPIYYSIVLRRIGITVRIAQEVHKHYHPSALVLQHTHRRLRSITNSQPLPTTPNYQLQPPQCSPASTTSVDAEAEATPQTAAVIAVLSSTFNRSEATALHQYHQSTDGQQLPTRP